MVSRSPALDYTCGYDPKKEEELAILLQKQIVDHGAETIKSDLIAEGKKLRRGPSATIQTKQLSEALVGLDVDPTGDRDDESRAVLAALDPRLMPLVEPGMLQVHFSRAHVDHLIIDRFAQHHGDLLTNVEIIVPMDYCGNEHLKFAISPQQDETYEGTMPGEIRKLAEERLQGLSATRPRSPSSF